jgi:hypothetical protein
MKLSNLFNLFGKKAIFNFSVGDFECHVTVRGQAPTTLDQLQRNSIREALECTFSNLIAERVNIPVTVDKKR